MHLSLVECLHNLKLSVGHQRSVAGGIRPEREFYTLLSCERARADRNQHDFSLLVFHEKGAVETEQLVHVLSRRIREIDAIGWLDSGHMGVLLPYTSFSGAKIVAEDICRMTAGAAPHYTIDVYRAHWLRDQEGRAANHVADPVSGGEILESGLL